MDRVSKAERELVRKMQKQTNADRIRAMTDEELATLIADNIDCNICKEMHDTKYERCPGNINEEKGCCAIWLDWLKQEATNG